MESLGCPGWIHTAPFTVCPWCLSSTRSSFCRLSFSAVAALTRTALSHVKRVTGLGSSCIAPHFEWVGHRNVPLAQLRGLVVEIPTMHAQPRLLELADEIEVGGRVVGRVDADDDQGIDGARVEVGHQRFEIGQLIGGI